MIGQDPLYQVLSSLYDARTLAQFPLPGVVQSLSEYPLNRSPLQVQGYGARQAPTPKQQDSGEGGLAGLIMAGGSLFMGGGPLAALGAESSAGSFLGNVAGAFNPAYFNTNTASGLDSYLSATMDLK